MLDMLPFAVFAALLIIAASTDIATMTIPNWVSIALAALFPVIALVSGASLELIGWHFLFAFAVLVGGFALFQMGFMGGGDAKLIAAAALWTGFAAFGPFALWTVLAGGVMALVLLIVRSRIKPTEARPAFVNRLLKPRGGVPYGVAILAGGLMTQNALPFAAWPLTLP
jgi:prepilin peptidase CpaA